MWKPHYKTEVRWGLPYADRSNGAPIAEPIEGCSLAARSERMTRKNRSDVVAAARVLFAEQGFHGTSMPILVGNSA